MYAQSLNAEASDFSGRVAVEERLKAVEIDLFNRKIDFNRSLLPCGWKLFQLHFNRFNRTSTVPGSFWRGCRLSTIPSVMDQPLCILKGEVQLPPCVDNRTNWNEHLCMHNALPNTFPPPASAYHYKCISKNWCCDFWQWYLWISLPSEYRQLLLSIPSPAWSLLPPY